MKLSTKCLYALAMSALWCACMANVPANGPAILIEKPLYTQCRRSGHMTMTFEYGPTAHSGIIMEALEKRKVRGAFFAVVDYLDNPIVMANFKRAAERHVVGLAVDDKTVNPSMEPEDVVAAINVRADVLARLGGLSTRPVYVRIANYNLMPLPTLIAVSKAGYKIVGFNLDSMDYNGAPILKNFEDVVGTLTAGTKGSFITVNRDSSVTTIQGIAEVIDYFQKEGYQIVTLDECFQQSTVRPTWNGVGPKAGAGVPSSSSPGEAALATTAVAAAAAALLL